MPHRAPWAITALAVVGMFSSTVMGGMALSDEARQKKEAKALQKVLVTRCREQVTIYDQTLANLRGDLTSLQSDVRFYDNQIASVSGLGAAFASVVTNYQTLRTARLVNITKKQGAIDAMVAAPPNCDEIQRATDNASSVQGAHWIRRPLSHLGLHADPLSRRAVASAF